MRKAAFGLFLGLVLGALGGPALAGNRLAGGGVVLGTCDGSCLPLRPLELEARLCGVLAPGPEEEPSAKGWGGGGGDGGERDQEEEYPAPTCEPIRPTLILNPSLDPSRGASRVSGASRMSGMSASATQAPASQAMLWSVGEAVFSNSGEAAVGVSPESFCFRGVRPLETSCGLWRWRGSLSPGPQPVSTLLALRTSPLGGSFAGALTFRLRLTFTSANDGREVAWDEAFTFFGSGPWADRTTAALPPVGGACDHDCDGVADAPLPNPADLQVGWNGSTPQPFWLAGDGQLCLAPLVEAPFFPPGAASAVSPQPPKEDFP